MAEREQYAPPPVPGQYFYDKDTGFRMPQGGTRQPDPETLKILMESITAANAEIADYTRGLWEQRQKTYEAMGADLTRFYQGAAEFAKAQADLQGSKMNNWTRWNSDLGAEAAKWMMNPADPNAVDALSATLLLQANAASEAVKASGQVQSADQWLAATADARAAAARDFSSIGTLDQGMQMGTARNMRRAYSDVWGNTLAQSGLSPEQQAAAMAKINEEANGALQQLGPQGYAYAQDMSEASSALMQVGNQMIEDTSTPGSHSSYSEWAKQVAPSVAALNNADKLLTQQLNYEQAVPPELRATIAMARSMIDQQTGDVPDPLTTEVARFQNAHPWFGAWAKAMAFSDTAYAARHLVRYPEQIRRLDEMYEKDKGAFQRAEDNGEARRQLRQQLRGEMAGPGTSVHPLLRGIVSLANPIGATPVDPSQANPRSSVGAEAYDRSMTNAYQDRARIILPPSAPTGAPVAPGAPLAPGGATAPLAPSAPESPGGRPPRSTVPPKKNAPPPNTPAAEEVEEGGMSVAPPSNPWEEYQRSKVNAPPNSGTGAIRVGQGNPWD